MIRTENNVLPIPAVYISQLQQTKQNPRFHAEGNVYQHTLLVLEKFYEYADHFGLNSEEKEVMYWAAVLHDIGKPSVTRKQNGRWVARGHELAGVSIARDILLARPEIGVQQRHKILDLVRWHHIPLRWGMAQKPIWRYKHLAAQTDIRLLGAFAFFDLMGRDCETHEQVEEIIGDFNASIAPRVQYDLGDYEDVQFLFEETSYLHQNALWKSLKADDPTLLDRLLNFGIEDSFDAYEGSCSFAIGPHGSGKTEFLEQEYPKAIWFDTDDYLRHLGSKDPSICREGTLQGFQQFLAQHEGSARHIVIDGNNLDEPLRRAMAELMRERKISIKYHWFEKPLAVCLENAHVPAEITVASYHAQHLLHPWEAHECTFE